VNLSASRPHWEVENIWQSWGLGVQKLSSLLYEQWPSLRCTSIHVGCVSSAGTSTLRCIALPEWIEELIFVIAFPRRHVGHCRERTLEWFVVRRSIVVGSDSVGATISSSIGAVSLYSAPFVFTACFPVHRWKFVGAVFALGVQGLLIASVSRRLHVSLSSS
jgi:hypothetical protein